MNTPNVAARAVSPADMRNDCTSADSYTRLIRSGRDHCLNDHRGWRSTGCEGHRHVFIDPDPDPETSFAERERLFRLPRSSWADYDPAKISAGGGVFARNLKRVPLPARARELYQETQVIRRQLDALDL